MAPEELVAAAEGLEVDDLADLLRELPETVNQQVLRSMDSQDRERLNAVLGFEQDTAGGLDEHGHRERAAGRHARNGVALPAHARRDSRENRCAFRRESARPLSGRAAAHEVADRGSRSHRW
jgi:hypothetical protein